MPTSFHRSVGPLTEPFLIQFRSRNIMTRLKNMLSVATTSHQNPSLLGTVERWEIVLYIRDFLREMSLPDLSLVDVLIDVAGNSLSDASFACALVRFGSEDSMYHRLPMLLGCTPPPYSIAAVDTLSVICGELDTEISAEISNASRFNAILKTLRDSSKLGGLHRDIAFSCLRTMNELLQFNQCSVPSSYTPNSGSQGEELFQDAQRKGHITPALLYACSHWAHHASLVSSNEGMVPLTISFLKVHALHWLEIINITNQDPLSTLSQLSTLRVSEIYFFCVKQCIESQLTIAGSEPGAGCDDG